MYEDITKPCVSCKREFTWTAGEQSFMNDLKEKGKIEDVIEPKRCKPCRDKAKAKRERQEQSGGSY